MRTTLNLDDDVVAQLTALSRSKARSLSRVANELIRAGLRAAQTPTGVREYDPPTFETGRPLVDVRDVSAALEVLEGGD
jgi:hypothetical protein